MKRIIALLLCLTFLLTLGGCKNGKKNGGNGVDIEYFANLGQIPENDITLGTTPEKLKETLDKRGEEAEKNGEHYGYNEVEGENNVLVEEGPYDYYYKKANPQNGVAYIVSYQDAYGFKIGDIIVEVEEHLSDYEVEKLGANDKNAFFYFGDYNKAQILRIPFKNNTVLFLFEDNSLCATAIYRNDF